MHNIYIYIYIYIKCKCESEVSSVWSKLCRREEEEKIIDMLIYWAQPSNLIIFC